MLVEVPDVPAIDTREQPRIIHLFPKTDGWILMALEKGEQGMHFADLGRALDAATAGDRQVHIVVHERGAA